MVKTEKLFYNSAYIKEFTAMVLDCQPVDRGYEIVLDKTVFFPEEGGQRGDVGYIGAAQVIDTVERNGIIYHITDISLKSGDTVPCHIDFDLRYVRMQNHTGEHLICGIIHKLYGFENVGFHLGDGYMTFDVSGILTQNQINEVELLANKAVWENRDIKTYFPSENELQALEYRSKSEIYDNIRIVEIDGYDICACCAPHVDKTGEIGLIKVTDFMKYKGGTRIFAICGLYALNDYCKRIEIAKNISIKLSSPQDQIDTEVHKLCDDIISQKQEISALRSRIADMITSSLKETDGNIIIFEELDANQMRRIVNEGMMICGGICAVFSGNDIEGYRYIIGSKTIDLGRFSRTINESINGRGGGKGTMIQGSASAIESKIKEILNDMFN